MSTSLVKVEFTVEELDALRTSAISMHSKLSKDPYTSAAEVEFWYKLQDKMLMAKIRQTDE